MKTANEILLEHGINIMSFNDEFNSQLLNAMERYAEEKISDSDEEPDATQYFHNHAVTFFGINAGSYLYEEDFMKYARWKASLKPNKLTESSIKLSHADITRKALEIFGDEDSDLNIKQHEAFIKGAIWVLAESVFPTPNPNKLSDTEIEKMAEEYAKKPGFTGLGTPKNAFIAGCKAIIAKISW